MAMETLRTDPDGIASSHVVGAANPARPFTSTAKSRGTLSSPLSATGDTPPETLSDSQARSDESQFATTTRVGAPTGSIVATIAGFVVNVVPVLSTQWLNRASSESLRSRFARLYPPGA